MMNVALSRPSSSIPGAGVAGGGAGVREAEELEQALDSMRVRVELQREGVQVARRRSREAIARAGAVRDRLRTRFSGVAADWCDQDRVARRLQLARQELIEVFAQARAVQYAPGSPEMTRLRHAEEAVQRLQADYYHPPAGRSRLGAVRDPMCPG